MRIPKMVLQFSLVFPGQQVEKRMFPYRKPTAYITVPSATALACDSSYASQLHIYRTCSINFPMIKSNLLQENRWNIADTSYNLNYDTRESVYQFSLVIDCDSIKVNATD